MKHQLFRTFVPHGFQRGPLFYAYRFHTMVIGASLFLVAARLWGDQRRRAARGARRCFRRQPALHLPALAMATRLRPCSAARS
jgi:hypothetical protein